MFVEVEVDSHEGEGEDVLGILEILPEVVHEGRRQVEYHVSATHEQGIHRGHHRFVVDLIRDFRGFRFHVGRILGLVVVTS